MNTLAGQCNHVRALELRREAAGEEDEAVQRFARAMRRSARGVWPIELDLAGLTLAPGPQVLASAPLTQQSDLSW